MQVMKTEHSEGLARCMQPMATGGVLAGRRQLNLKEVKKFESSRGVLRFRHH
jgi:hypothetical protein